MCDSHYKREILNKSTQPKTLLFDKLDCSDSGGGIPVNTGFYGVDDLKRLPGNLHDDIDTIILPPNVRGKASKDHHWGGGTGYYGPGGIIYLNKVTPGTNRISNLSLWRSGDSWDTHLRKCCLQMSGKGPSNCGDWYNSMSKCNTVMDKHLKGYSADSLAQKYKDPTYFRWKNKIISWFQNKVSNDNKLKLRCCQNDPKFNEKLCGHYWGNTHDSSCDSVLVNHCNNNWKTDDRCGCLLPTSEYDGTVYGMGVECLDGRCTSHPNPYQTYAQRTALCNITAVDCRALLDLQASEGGVANVGDVTIQQECSKYDLPNPEPPIIDPEPKITPESVFNEEGNTKTYIIGGIILVIMLVLFIALGIVLFYLLFKR